MERCRLVQDWCRPVCDIFTHRYGVPCRAIAKGYRILRFHTALRVILSTPPSGGTHEYTFYVEYPPFRGYEYTFYATLPRP
eukprot:2535530-Ditylum_brightwellii.AAC.1